MEIPRVRRMFSFALTSEFDALRFVDDGHQRRVLIPLANHRRWHGRPVPVAVSVAPIAVRAVVVGDGVVVGVVAVVHRRRHRRLRCNDISIQFVVFVLIRIVELVPVQLVCRRSDRVAILVVPAAENLLLNAVSARKWKMESREQRAE